MTYSPELEYVLPPGPEPHDTSSHNPYVKLPVANSIYAPKTFTGKTYELEPFLENYSYACQRYNINTSEDRYKGLVQYCSPKIAKTLRSFPSHKEKDFDLLLEELIYFYGNEDNTYNVGRIEDFTYKWRQRRITTLEQFKRYHRKYLALVGEAREQGRISEWDYDRYFWEGLNESFRRRVESRMMNSDSKLDVSVPFKLAKVVKGAEHILSPHRFDQHLITRSGYHSSDTEPEPEPVAPRYRLPKPADSSEDDSQDEVKPLYRKKPYFSPSKPNPPKGQEPKKKESDEFRDLVHKMDKLELTDPEYRILYAEAIRMNPDFKDALDRPVRQGAQKLFTPTRYPNPPQNRFGRFPQQFTDPRPPPNSFQQNPPQQLGPNRFPCDLPPHQSSNNYQGPSSSIPYSSCYGCGKKGHQIRECREIEGLVKSRQILFDPVAIKFHWPDGTPISKAFGETWIQTIQNTKRANLVTINQNHQDPESVYSYIGVPREEDDASTDEQEELGWTSGQVRDCQAYGAERADRVSREGRKQVQFSPPGIPQGMKKFPERRKDQSLDRPHIPIQKNVRLDSNQARAAGRITPADPNKNVFEGKVNNEFLPMEVDQQLPGQLGDNSRKNLPHQRRTSVSKVTDPGPKPGKNSNEIVQKIMASELTMSVWDAIGISPPLRRELVSAVRQGHEVFSPTQEKTGLANGVEPYDQKEQETWEDPIPWKGLKGVRDDLAKVRVQIGDTSMSAIYDSGAQVSLMSKKLAEKIGLPWRTDKASRLRLISVDGKITQCVGKIPMARILVSQKLHPTYGDIHILPDSGFDLLLGRTWSSANQGQLKDERHGTYLSWKSRRRRRRSNVWLAPGQPNYDIDGETDPNGSEDEYDPYETENREYDELMRRSGMCAVAIGRIVPENEEEAPDSEPEVGETEASSKRPEISIDALKERECDFEYSPISDEDDFPTPAQRVQSIEGEREADEREDRAWNQNASPVSEGSRVDEKEVSEDDPDRFNWEQDLREDYIRMIQKGVSNEEWNAFCRDEKSRLRENKTHWKKWCYDDNDADDETVSTTTRLSNSRSTHNSTPAEPEPSQTLQTPNPTPPLSTV